MAANGRGRKHLIGIDGELDPLPSHIPPYTGSVNYKKCSPDVRRAYQSVMNQISRCYNPNGSDYSRYGARGIKVLYAHKDFVAWWIYNLPLFTGKKPCVSRIDHSDHYKFSNIQMSDWYENAIEPHKRDFRPWLDTLPHRKPVRSVCVKTGVVLGRYVSMCDASRKTGVHERLIWNHAHNPARKWGSRSGVRFEFDE